VLDPAPADPAIAASMGARGPRDEPPRLVAVIFARGAHPEALALVRRLAREGVAAAADDHGWLTGPVERQIFLAAAVCAVLGVALLLAFVAIAALASRRRSRALTSRIQLLSRLGMSDGSLTLRLAGPVVLGLAAAAILGAALGCLLQGVFGIGLVGTTALIPAPTTSDLLLAAIWAPTAILFGGLAAVAVAARTVRRIWP
jgi:hypothetical protein